MKCDIIRQQLVELLYGESSAEEQQRIETHLAECGDCRSEWEALQQSQELLNQLSRDRENPQIDVAQICRVAVRRSEQRSRSWKWSAIVLGACAALFLACFLTQARIEFHASHAVIVWGELPAPQSEQKPVEFAFDDPSEQLNLLDRRLNALGELTNIAARDYLQSDQRHSTELATLLRQIQVLKKQTADQLKHLQVQSDLRWKLIRYDLSLQTVSHISTNNNIE